MEGERLKITSLEVLSGKRLPNQSYGTKRQKKKNTGREIGRGLHECNFQHFHTKSTLSKKKLLLDTAVSYYYRTTPHTSRFFQ